MLELTHFTLKNYHLWPTVSFAFEPGISLVTGANRSGKTMLFRGVKQALRAQSEKRGTSLSKLPKGSAIGLNFNTHDTEWATKLTPTVLSVTKNGDDQGATGKKAPKQLLAEAITIPSELFDSTIHVSGTGGHPLIDGTSSTRLAWMSSVLDLTDAYDVAAARIEKDLKAAITANTRLEILEDELKQIKLPAKLPNVKKMRAELQGLRDDADRYARGERLLDALDAVRVRNKPSVYEDAIAVTKADIKHWRAELRVAETYETEHERATLVRDLRDRLAALGTPTARASTLTAFCNALEQLGRTIEDLQFRWTNSEGDRRIYAKLKEIVREGPVDLDGEISKMRAQSINAREQYQHLRHIEGAECPVCNAKLTNARRKELTDRAGKLWNGAEDKLMKLQRFIDARDKLSNLERRVSDLQAPPTRANLRPLITGFFKEAKRATEAEKIKGRLTDLKADTTDLVKPKHSVKEINRILDEEDQRLIDLRVKLEHAGQAAEIETKLAKLFGAKYDAKHIRNEAAGYRADIEDLVAAIAQGEQLLEEVKRQEAAMDRLEDEIESLFIEAHHLEELTELKEAMGRKGLRLTKIKDLCAAFQAEFNNLVPLFWSDPFTLEFDVKESGLDVYATRNQSREDLLSLSGSETKVWKLLCALVLIRLLPDRLRCDTIILDELEANMDPDTRRRFVTEYLPELGKSIAKIVLVSPLDYQDLPLAPTASYQVVKHASTSALKKVA